MPRTRPGRTVAAVVCAGAVMSALSADAAPAGRRVGRQGDGSVVLPTNQEIRPAGVQVEFDGRPSAVAMSPDGATAAVLTSQGPAITVVSVGTGTVLQTLHPEQGDAAFTGVLYSRDGRQVYASVANGIVVASVGWDGTLEHEALIPTGTIPGGLALSADGRRLYATLTEENALAVVDVAARRVRSRIAVGNAPHSVVLVGGGQAVVSNRGGRRARPGETTNESAGTPIVSRPSSGSAATGTVSVVDLHRSRVVAEVRVGLHPGGMAVRGDHVFVANANSDTVSVLDVRRRAVAAVLSVQPFPGAPFGSSPTAVAVLDATRLLVTLGRNNAVAVLSWSPGEGSARVDGLLPTGWYPSDVVVHHRTQRIVVVNGKGVGALGPADRPAPPAGGIGGPAINVRSNRGSVSLMGWPTADSLREGTAQVFAGNHWDTLAPSDRGDASAPPRAVPERLGEPSLIKHVFLIIKENRTYDQVLGDDPRGNGDPTKVHFGAAVTPNQHALAVEFPLLDNFYVNGTVSADGHHWLVQSFVTDYVEEAFTDWSRSYPYDGGDALAYAPTPFLWEHAQRYGRTVKVYGEFADHTDATGTRSDIPSLDRVLVRRYPRFDLGITDMTRADIFIEELAAQVAADAVPNLSIIQLPKDHARGLAPGVPSPETDVADNDHALGRIVEAVSASPIWATSAIFVVEDDAQFGLDHVDGHRTTAFVISPYARRGIVDSRYYTQIDMLRTIEAILGLPPMNQVDLLATPMREVFTDVAVTAPYVAIVPAVPPQRNPELATLGGLPLQWAQACARIDFTQPDAAPGQLLNRAIWYAIRGWVPYPGDTRVLTPDEALALEPPEE